MATGSRAVKAEASKQTDPDKPVLVRQVTFEHKGVEYTMRGDTMEDVEILEAMEDERYITAIRSIVGNAAWARFKESVRTPEGRVLASELEEFLQKVMGELDPQLGS